MWCNAQDRYARRSYPTHLLSPTKKQPSIFLKYTNNTNKSWFYISVTVNFSISQSPNVRKMSKYAAYKCICGAGKETTEHVCICRELADIRENLTGKRTLNVGDLEAKLIKSILWLYEKFRTLLDSSSSRQQLSYSISGDNRLGRAAVHIPIDPIIIGQRKKKINVICMSCTLFLRK